jgi:hypothetical protein
MAAAIGDELAEALGPAVGDRAEQVVVVGDADGYVVVLGGLGFGETDPAVLGAVKLPLGTTS